MSAEIESPGDMAERLYPLRPSASGGPLASVESRSVVACVASAIRADREQIMAALEAAAEHQDWCGPYPQYTGAAAALRAFAARLGASR